jgi:glycosyltransferase involved in cell wall biosynthesis
MMKVAMIARSTLYTVPGGDTVQAVQTCRFLNELGINAEIRLTYEFIDYTQYDLLHFFNIIRPADILYHIKKSAKPYVVSTILVDYSEYDKYHRKSPGALFSRLSGDGIEYLKTTARWLLGRDQLKSISYLFKGQRKSIVEILNHAALILPNSLSEYRRLVQAYTLKVKYQVVTNGIDVAVFTNNEANKKDNNLVLCVARIEGIKNQLNLIKGLNNTRFRVLLIGNHSPNQAAYYRECTDIAAKNISFIKHVPQGELVAYYKQAKVHILPSWFETTGLSSIEAAAMGCNIVITDKGDTKEYFGNDAFYCDPAKPESLLAAVEKASNAPYNKQLKNKILEKYTWAQAASQTLTAYQTAIA